MPAEIIGPFWGEDTGSKPGGTCWIQTWLFENDRTLPWPLLSQESSNVQMFLWMFFYGHLHFQINELFSICLFQGGAKASVFDRCATEEQKKALRKKKNTQMYMGYIGGYPVIFPRYPLISPCALYHPQ